MTTKYDGMHKAAANIVNNKATGQGETIQVDFRPETIKKSARKRGFSFWKRLIAAGALFLLLFAVSKAETAFTDKIIYYAKYAVCYDLDQDHEKNLGEITAVSLLKDELQKEREQED